MKQGMRRGISALILCASLLLSGCGGGAPSAVTGDSTDAKGTTGESGGETTTDTVNVTETAAPDETGETAASDTTAVIPETTESTETTDSTETTGSGETTAKTETTKKEKDTKKTETTKEEETTDPSMSDPENIVAEAYARSFLYAGSENMQSSLASVLKKAKEGKPVTLCTFGDSITLGAGAETGKGWSDDVAAWMEGLDGNTGNHNVTLVNAGIGATEAVYGVMRTDRDVLAHDPDMVIVDFGTNDWPLPNAIEAYEGILCKLISAGVPVINGNVSPRDGNNMQDRQLPLNKAYGVPQVSFRSAYYELSKTTSVKGFRADDIWTADNVHPTTAGHRLYADLLITYMENELLGKNVGDTSLTLPQPVTKNRFADLVFCESNMTGLPVKVTMGDGWEAYEAMLEQLQSNGWQTKVIGSEITFTFNASCFSFIYAKMKKSGNIEVYVDGVKKTTYTDANSSQRSISLGQTFFFENGPAEHTVKFVLLDNSRTENDWCGLCCAAVSGF